jgi:hypothetical protein
MASGVDARREARWGERAETILLFVNSAFCFMIYYLHVLQAGLFAAVLTAFLVFTITKLQADSSDISKDILLRISLQLSNSSVPAFVEPEFFVASQWAAVNALLFASLALVLVDAYLAVLTRSWLRDFDRSWKYSSVPEERARKREMRLQGLKRWKLQWVVALLPLLIQASLILFCISLVLMLINLYRPIAYPTLGIFAAGFCFHLFTAVVSILDTNAPFMSFNSRALRALIRWSHLRRVFFVILSRLKWRPWRTAHRDTDDAEDELGGTEIHLAISNRLHAATSNAVENLPVFMEVFDQWVHMPSLHPRRLSDWRQVLPLVQPYLSNESLCNDHILRSVARLSLCFNAKEFHTGRQAVIKALGKHNAGASSIEQLYIHLLHQAESDWLLACQVVPKLEADRSTIMELRWILDWVVFRLTMKNQDIPNERDSPRVSMQGVTFLCSTSVYVIQNRIMNDDHGLFNSLLLITKLIINRSKKVDPLLPNMGLQTSSNGIDGELLVSRNSRVPRENRWQFIDELYTMSCISAAGCKHSLRLLIMLLMISMNSAVDYLDIYDGITYDLFTNPEKDLPMLMDILWETWRSRDAQRHLLIGIAAWLLQRDSSFVHKSPPNPQQSVQDLLDAYDSYTSGSTLLVTSNGLLFVEAMLSFTLDGDSTWEPQIVNLRNPWLVMHIHNILRRDWRVPAGSAMREAVWGRLDSLGRPDWLDKWLKWLDRLEQLLYRLKQFDRLEDPRSYFRVRLERLDPQLKQLGLRLKRLKRLKWLDRFSPLDPLFEQLNWFDRFNQLLEQLNELDPYLKQLNWLDRFNQLDQITRFDQIDLDNLRLLDQQLNQQLDQQLDQLNQQLDQRLEMRLEMLDLDQQLHQLEEQRSTVLGMIARSRLNLYNSNVLLGPDLVPLSLFLSPRDTHLFSDSRRRILELFRSTPSVPPLPPPDTTEPEVVDARVLCSDFFDSNAIGDLTKWRMLAFVVFFEWETVSTQWKDLLAAEVLKVERVDDQRVDWMARVTPLLAGEFNLSEFLVAEGSNSDVDADDDSTYGTLTPMHLRMVAIVVEHLGADRLTDQTIRELEKFLERHSDILWDQKELGRVRTVISQAKARYPQSGIPLAQVDSGITTAGASHSAEWQSHHESNVQESFVTSPNDQVYFM